MIKSIKNHKISVIIPVYNVEAYLRQCLDSVISQTYKNLEIIIVDDWSTDNSWEICDEYAKKDKRIKIIHQENKGLSAARNIWLKMATWKYIWYIDSDDYVELDMYEKLYKIIEKTGLDMAISNRYIWQKDWSRIVNTNFPNKEIITSDEALEYFYDSLYVRNKLYRKDIIKGLDFVETRAQDVIYNFDIIKRIKRIACLNECKNYYRYNPNSIVHTKKFKKNRLIFIKDGLDKEIDYAGKNCLYSLKNNLIEKKVGYAVYWLSLLALDNVPDIEAVRYLQNIVRKYFIKYLKSKRNFIKKCFCIMVLVDFKLASIIYKSIKTE